MSERALEFIEAEKQNKTGRLFLRHLGLTAFPEELQELHWLIQLDLSNNEIKDLQPLSKLTNLQLLNLSFNQIQDINALEKLINLQSLDLDSNQIQDLRPLDKLTRLESLSIYNNQIQDINALKKLSQLTILDLEDNRIERIDSLVLLGQIKELWLYFNHIQDISTIQNLVNLRKLSLDHNPIQDLSPLLSLHQLEYLGLQQLDLKDLSPLLPLLQRTSMDVNADTSNKGLNVRGNEIEKPPLEIVRQGREAILEWFEANKTALNEVKLILIGDPKAGKTSILRQLKDGTFNKNEPQTDGINIEDIHFGNCDSFDREGALKDITGHFWDFGGQEIMNSTHQFFLTKRSVYILVLNARNDNQIANQVRNWVQRIRATGGDSPIIVVANQIDVNRGFGFENESILRQDFPQIKAFLKVSCDTGENIESLIAELEAWIPQAELFRSEVDEKWLPIKDQMEKETTEKRYLTEERFLQICKDLNPTSRQSLVTFLHDLGLLLHFEGLGQILQEYYVLDPNWITYGVYQILTSNFAGSCKGIVPVDRLDYIVNEEPDKLHLYQTENFVKTHYSPAQRTFLVDILHEFKLCFYVNDRQHFIVPDLLETEASPEVTEPIRNDSDALRFVYEYTYLPKSIIPEIMVEAHHMLANIWRTGCLLTYEDSSALINADQNRIYITVVGTHKKKREFLSVLRYQLDQINGKLSDPPKMLIPLPGLPNDMVSYKRLLSLERARQEEYPHYSEATDETTTFTIAKLLEGITPFNDMAAVRKEMDKLGSKIDMAQSGIDQLIQTQEQHFETLTTQLGPEWKEAIIAGLEAVQTHHAESMVREVTQALATAFELHHADMNEELQTIYQNLKTAPSNTQLKLKVALPLLPSIVSVEGEFDLKDWGNNMYEKYKLPLFKMMGKIG